MTVIHAWQGAVTPSSVWVRAKVSGASARLAVSEDSAMTEPTYFGPVSVDGHGMVSVVADGLASNRRYWWAWEVDDFLNLDAAGTFRTAPDVGQPASFTFASGGCAGQAGVHVVHRVSNGPAFDTVRQYTGAEFAFFAHTGDFHYRDIGSGVHVEGHAAERYREAYDDVLTFNGQLGLEARQAALYRSMPLVYVWDDHDFGGNRSDSSAPGRANAQQVYRERVPHYDLPAASGAIFQKFQWGRVLFLAFDTRSDRAPGGHLGEEQMEWLRQTLVESAADDSIQAMCWIYPNPWMFTNSERAQVGRWLHNTGWANRLWMVSADNHHLAFDDGTNTPDGGFRRFVFAPMDSNPGNPDESLWSHGVRSGRGHWGWCNVQDNGDEGITVTGFGMLEDGSIWNSYTFTVGEGLVPPPPDVPDLPGIGRQEVAVPEFRERVEWYSFDLVSGRRIAALPSMVGEISRAIGAYTSTALTLPIPLSGREVLPHDLWSRATEPGVTLIVPVIHGVPSAGYIVLDREGGTDAELTLACVSLEAYLDRRFVGDHVWSQSDQSAIAAGLIGDADVEGINLTVDATATGIPRDRTYVDEDDVTVYSSIRELSAVLDGLEWTIDVDWQDDTHSVIEKVVRIHRRIGMETDTPHVLFSTLSDSSATYEYKEDYSEGAGANHVLATASSQGEDEDRPESHPAHAVLPGWPRYEQRFQPHTNIWSIPGLTSHAGRELQLRRDGARTMTISTRWDVYPMLNLHWRMGDDVRWEVKGHRHPNGFTGQGRLIGWQLSLSSGTITPTIHHQNEILLENHIVNPPERDQDD